MIKTILAFSFLIASNIASAQLLREAGPKLPLKSYRCTSIATVMSKDQKPRIEEELIQKDIQTTTPVGYEDGSAIGEGSFTHSIDGKDYYLGIETSVGYPPFDSEEISNAKYTLYNEPPSKESRSVVSQSSFQVFSNELPVKFGMDVGPLFTTPLEHRVSFRVVCEVIVKK